MWRFNVGLMYTLIRTRIKKWTIGYLCEKPSSRYFRSLREISRNCKTSKRRTYKNTFLLKLFCRQTGNTGVLRFANSLQSSSLRTQLTQSFTNVSFRKREVIKYDTFSLVSIKVYNRTLIYFFSLTLQLIFYSTKKKVINVQEILIFV